MECFDEVQIETYASRYDWDGVNALAPIAEPEVGESEFDLHRTWARRRLQNLGLKLIGLMPGNKWVLECWNAERT